ncbi:MAG: radical SAM protein [Candidatus Rifleibacteriota bacterium]
MNKELIAQLISSLSPEFRHLGHELAQKASAEAYLNRIVSRKTLSISVTGTYCEQDCSHCNGHFLKGMTPLAKLEKIDLKQYDSVLISGGSDKNGEVPIARYAKQILDLPENLILNIHPGFQPVEKLLFLKDRNCVFSFDLPASNDIIKNVFGLCFSKKEYEELFLEYSKNFKTIPHLNLGLGGPDCKVEKETIDFLANNHSGDIVFILFRPTIGTRLENQEAPKIEKVIEIFSYTRQRTKSGLLLGCMRPSGLYRKNIDILAWLSGIRNIVQPDHALINILKENSIPIEEKFRCCAL